MIVALRSAKEEKEADDGEAGWCKRWKRNCKRERVEARRSGRSGKLQEEWEKKCYTKKRIIQRLEEYREKGNHWVQSEILGLEGRGEDVEEGLRSGERRNGETS